MKSVSNGVQASSRSQELLLPSPQAFMLLVFLQLLLKGHLRFWFQMCKPLDCSFLLLIFFLISIIAGDDEVCKNNLRCFTLVEAFQIIVIVIASYFIADFISVVHVSKCCSIPLELLCSWMHCTTAFRGLDSLVDRDLRPVRSNQFVTIFDIVLASKEPTFMSSSCFSAPVCHLLPSCIAPLCFYLSVCLSPYKTTIGLMIFSPS